MCDNPNCEVPSNGDDKTTKEMETIELWIKNDLMPRVIEANKKDIFENLQIVSYEVQAMEGNKDNWASIMFTVFMVLRDTSEKKFQLMIKLMPETEQKRVKMHSNLQFSNEILLYSVALPFFKSQPSKVDINDIIKKMVPDCYYTLVTETVPGNPRLDDGIIVMEDLRPLNYKLGNRTFLDLKHCMLAMETIGSFHALSYLSKERDRISFENTIVQHIHETNYAVDNQDLVKLIFPIAQRRVLGALEKMSGTKESDTPERAAGIKRLRAIAARDPYDLFLELAKPKEPLAVLCHGDFLRNNVLFRYEDDAPVDMKLIDFQTIRYASPAIDVSLFLCMNTCRELRASHFQQLLRAYHRSLRSTLSALLGVGEEQLPERYHFDAFMDDFRTHALYGYLISIEFIPWMMTEEDFLAEYVQLYMNDMFSPKFSELASVIGGEAATKVNAELAQDLIDFGCL